MGYRSVIIATTLAASGQTNADVPQPINLERISSFEHFLRSSLLIPPKVAFIDSDRLAVTFLNPCPELPVDRLPRLKDGEEDNRPCGLTLTMLLVDTKTSQIHPTMSLPFHTVRQSQPSARSGFRLRLPTRRGEFLVHTGDFLLRYGPNLEPIEKRPISNPDRSIVYVSPDGRLALINEYEDVGKLRKFVFPSDDIQAGSLFGVGWPAEGVMNDGSLLSSIWDAGVWNAKPTDTHGGNGRTQKCIRQPGACVLLCASEANCQILGQLLSPVDDQKFAARIAGRRNIKRFAIVDRTGKVLYVGRASDPVVGFAVGAPAAQRLMIMGHKLD